MAVKKYFAMSKIVRKDPFLAERLESLGLKTFDKCDFYVEFDCEEKEVDFVRSAASCWVFRDERREK